MMKDELIVGEHRVDGTQLLIYILYIFIHRCINFFAILVSQVRCYCNLYFLSFIVIMYWTKFLYELYSNSRILIHYIEGHYFILFFVSIIGCHSCSYSAILIVFCTFKFSHSLGLEKNFFLSFPPLHSFLSLPCAFTQVYARLWEESCAFIWRAFLP